MKRPPIPHPLRMREAERAWLGRRACDVIPRNRQELARWVAIVLGVEPVERALLPSSRSPLDYLEWAFLRDPLADTSNDCVVWASRGSGKTLYAAVATVLDLVFRAGIEVKILGGSREQAQRMHAHLRRMFERPGISLLVDGRFGERRGRLLNGSTVEVLAQSERSVRGTRPQKLRCDEVELFDEDVWAAAQLVTRSRRCGRPGLRALVPGSVEAFSTCHRPGGLMSTLIAQASAPDPPRTLFKWNVIDVLERCPSPPRPDARTCESCALQPECAGAAKKRRDAGHFSIADALVMKQRSGKSAWESEMLCIRPMRRNAVYQEFDPARHVYASAEEPLESTQPDPCSPVSVPSSTLIAGMDFGFRSPTAIVWATFEAASGIVRVIDERIEAEALFADHLRALNRPPQGQSRAPRWIGVDPAGCQRSDQTGESPVSLLKHAGFEVRHRRATIESGLRDVRARLQPAEGPPRLLIHARCTRLIDAMMNYRYDDRDRAPLKDGHDHAVDALRYMITNLDPRPTSTINFY